MSSIFDGKPGGEPSSADEMAALVEANPEPPAPEPAETPAPAPEAAPPEAPAAPEQPQPTPPEAPPEGGKTVPLAALSEERARNRELTDQIGQIRGQLEAMQRMFQPPPAQPGQPQQDQPPDAEQDPIAAVKWVQEQIAKQTQINQAQALQVRVQQDYVADTQQFAIKTADFPQAYQHLVQGRVAELRAQGWQDAQIRDQVQREEFNIVLGSLKAGRSPAEAIYKLSEARGYKKAAPVAPPPAQPDPALQEARAKAAVSLSEGGKPAKADLSLDDIANLKGAAQESALKKWEERNHGRKSIFPE